MTDILFTANGASATALVSGELTSGMVGLPVRFSFDSDWDGLNIVAVFDGGGQRISVPLLTDMEAVLPWEVIAKANTRLRIGAEGRKSDGSIVIPTVWANAGYITEGAVATDEEGNPPTPGIYDQIMAAIEAGQLQGKPGDDGVSPTVSVTEIEGGHRVTITDKEGTKSFDVKDGKDAIVNIVDNLGSSDPNAALSARMGGVLKAKIEDDVSALNEQLQPQIKQRVKTVNGVAPDENGNVVVEVPEGSGNVDLSGYATEQWVRDGYQPKGNYLTEVPAGYAKTEDVPTKPEDIGAQPAGSYLTEVPSGYATEEYVRNKIAEAELGGEEVDLSGYAQKSELPTKVSQLQNDSGFITDYTETDPTVPSWAKQASKPSYTAAEVGARPATWTPSASDVGADTAGTAANEVSDHNKSDSSHGDIRLLITGLTNRLNALANSTDTDLDQMAELVAYIKNNKSLIDGITTGKVSVSDIVNNLTTNVANKPLSAAQGVALKALIDAITVPTKLSQLANDKGYLTQHQDISGKVDKAGLSLGRHADGLLYVFVDGQPVGDGVDLPTGGIDGYITPDKQIVFNNLPDGEYTLAYINDDGSIVPIGAMEKDTNVYYTVTNTLTQCTTNNSATQAVQGGSYSATITAKSGYELSSIVVKMGGTDISSTAVSGSKITISNVTGNIVITATATEIVASYTNLAKNFTTGRFNSSGAVDASTTAATACTDYIGPLKQGDVIRIKGFGACQDYNTQWANASKGNDSCSKLGTTSSNYSYSYDSNTGIVTLTKTDSYAGCTYCRISGKLTGTTADVIITLNEPIV